MKGESPAPVKKEHTEGDGRLPLPAKLHPSPLLLNWREWLCKTTLSGLAREVAAGSAVDELDGTHVTLAPASMGLVSEAVVSEIRAALEKGLGHAFEVRFSGRERREDEVTVTQVVETERLMARRAMVEAFKSDPFVQECVRRLGAEVTDTSVRPLTIDELKELERNAWKYPGPARTGSKDAKKR